MDNVGAERAQDRAPSQHRWRREMLLLSLLYMAYSASRSLADDSRIAADAHAGSIWRVEHLLGLDVESSLNAALLHAPWVGVVASYWYASLHYAVTMLVLVLLWRRRPQRYGAARTVLVLATGFALACYLVYPTTPPRLMPGYVDTLSTTAQVGWWGSGGSTPLGLDGIINELAAMPSMHVGWAFWSALYAWSIVSRRWLRAVVWTYPLITIFVVIATANHWVLDAAMGAVLVLTAGAVVYLPLGRPALSPSGAFSNQSDG